MASMRFPKKEEVQKVKDTYKRGDRVVLIFMEDFQAPRTRTQGTVTGVDDIGTVHISWDNGSSLGAVVLEGDIIEKVTA